MSSFRSALSLRFSALAFLLLAPLEPAGIALAEGKPGSRHRNVGLAAAAATASFASTAVNETLNDCATDQPGSAFAFRMAAVIWRSSNLRPVLLAEQLLQTRYKKSKSDLLETAGEIHRRLTPLPRLSDGSLASCRSFAESVYSGREDLKARYPRAAEILAKEMPVDARFEDAVMREDFTIGCMKGRNNKGFRSFEESKALCDCNTEVFFQTLDRKSRREFLAARQDVWSLPYLRTHPEMKKLGSGLARCTEPQPGSSRPNSPS